MHCLSEHLLPTQKPLWGLSWASSVFQRPLSWHQPHETKAEPSCLNSSQGILIFECLDEAQYRWVNPEHEFQITSTLLRTTHTILDRVTDPRPQPQICLWQCEVRSKRSLLPSHKHKYPASNQTCLRVYGYCLCWRHKYKPWNTNHTMVQQAPQIGPDASGGPSRSVNLRNPSQILWL